MLSLNKAKWLELKGKEQDATHENFISNVKTNGHNAPNQTKGQYAGQRVAKTGQPLHQNRHDAVLL